MTTEVAARVAHERLQRMLGWFTRRAASRSSSALWLQREGTSESLATFMGLYWLTGGILALAFHRELRRAGARRMPIVAGIFASTAGSALLIRSFLLKEPPSEEETFTPIGLPICRHRSDQPHQRCPDGTDVARRWNEPASPWGCSKSSWGWGWSSGAPRQDRS